MPACRTLELLPDCWSEIMLLFSTTQTDVLGRMFLMCIAVDRPTRPPPMIRISVFVVMRFGSSTLRYDAAIIHTRSWFGQCIVPVVIRQWRLYPAVMTTNNAKTDRDYDLIVWGASGFTGRLVVEYLAARYPQGNPVRWAVGGRNREKLDKVLDAIDFADERPDVLTGDGGDPESMNDMARRTRVVLTTVGPYAKYGTPLVAACAQNGTDYVDLCGEVQWMRRIIEEHHEAAENSGARIVMSCGFDSIPSDFGAWCLHREAMKRTGSPCSDVSLLVKAMKGGASGGTFASMLNAIDQAKADKRIARVLADPYALNPEGEREGPDGREQRGARFDDLASLWTAPFVMASVNTRVVRRSNALQGYPYGKDFRYRESTITGRGIKGRLRAMLMSWGLGAFIVGAAIPFTRKLIVKRIIPSPGEGPSRAQRENGFFNLVMYGRMNDGDVLKIRITGDRDPGYGSTSKMISESAVCLALGEVDAAGGCWTPASAMGDALLSRLTANAGLTFDPE